MRNALPIALLAAFLGHGRAATPPGFKVAFFGDQGLGPNSEAVLRLVKSEGADALVHLGDFDYFLDPAAWEAQTNAILGKDFPQFAVMGNHDQPMWAGQNGYQRLIRERLDRLGIAYHGEAGTQYSFHYRGVFFVFTTPGLVSSDHAGFIRRELDSDGSPWRISAWHVNQSSLQVGGKSDEAGWEVYEESLRGGAIIATAHEHSYSRTHLLRSMRGRTVDSRSDTLRLARGRTFAFVNGLGGGEIRPQLRQGDWWASVYTGSQGAVHGALFGAFNAQGEARRADFYFKNVNGEIVDRFTVISKVGLETPPDQDPGLPKGDSAESGWPRLLRINLAALGLPAGKSIRVYSLAGRAAPSRLNPGATTLSVTVRHAGIYFVRPEGSPLPGRKIIVLP